MTKDELPADIEAKIKNYCVKFFIDKYYEKNAEKNYCEFMKKSEKEIRKFVLQCDLDYLNSKDRELNSFEQGIKEECERLLKMKKFYESQIDFLKKIDKNLDKALDPELSDYEGSFDLLYLISEEINDKIKELETKLHE